MKRERLVVIGPLPPPYHGVTVSTSLVLENPVLRETFAVDHVDTSDHRKSANIGKWDFTNVSLGIRGLAMLAWRLRERRGVVYLPLSQNAPAFLRDSLLLWAASARGWKVAVHLRGSDFKSFYGAASPILQLWIRSTLRRVDSAAVMGGSLRWVFDGLVPSERIAVVANGTPAPRPVNVSRDPEHVLFLSNLRRRKGVVEALDAACLVLSERPGAHFSFVGSWEDPVLEEELRRRAAAFDGSINFRTPVEGQEKDELLASAAVLLFPPVEPEGHPRVVLEAMAVGLAIVTTDRGAIRETVVDGESGFVLADPTPRDLADRVLTLLDDKALRDRIGRAARARYLEHFTQEHADRRFADWMTSVGEGS